MGRKKLILGLATVLVLGASTAALAQEADPGAGAQPEETALVTNAVPPGEAPLGIPYGEWGARWWVWFASVLASEHPGAIDNCQAGQEGEVFFVPHVPPGVALTTTCVVSAGQWVLANGGSTLCDAAGGWGETEAEQRACVEGDKPVFSNVTVSIDGVMVPGMIDRWVISPQFELTLPEGNIFGAPAGKDEGVTGGWWVMFRPLPIGSHTIVVHDDIDIPGDEEGPIPAILIANIEVVEGS